ncbi:2-hydroxychromene-2-carboxylate isomerase [Cupriavidus necator]|uniref:2-hydroxychromene-2-carboxylate isomerase n=1 Tax=Cupriavidus necator (strain ATCC 17699 / DSM 428 / KCTC 22496 / NCIMB 10442 / H16 / Stanier 337) TaxID=381666 RepID=Q0KAH2_CUPNH|nr:2-hydroxychromene-2-carboxylate isomerase [Cupriavidus necator]KUE85026.1 2-hydroxychromene-2-carboxylate isomerase [Cupriavidus necator]QCC00837.1 2-hydroxychromene-2-carboxylate isomerase [Cupriavidus necator H16]QQB76332.1 2-hydroxychromene-2-carboxylate isomerase [Cupriavidus necator]WKA39205.1 2-hydroxychromene-2-carboxylate isomerase [Cupriavidus necator]CAJ92999.1 2-Hydroxychromene-2-carboxylate isomerase [Cupriavidus necator H16]
MTKAIDYYFWINSDWAYLGHGRLVELAKRQGAAINYMPVDLPYVYSQTGGILLGQRSQERQAYRITELARWCKRLGIPVNPQPRYMCPNGDLASCMVISAKHAGLCEGTLAQAILHAEWLEDQDISSPETLQTIARSLDLDGEALLCQAASPVIKAEYRQYTDNAISAGVFGSPAYVYRGEVFWGQDRLDFLEDTLACT